MEPTNDSAKAEDVGEGTGSTGREENPKETGAASLPRLVKDYVYEPGVARIKAEYLNLNYKPKIVTEYLPQDVKEELLLVEQSREKAKKNDEASSHDPDDSSQPPQKKIKKLKGQHKKRPIAKHSDPSTRLCPAFVTETQCSFGERCKFNHNVEEYFKAKPADLGSHCYNFETFGKCPYGITCRYAGQHISEDFKNVMNEELHARTCKETQTLNTLSKDVQTKLRRRQYDFTLAESTYKNVGKKTEKSETQSNNDVLKASVPEQGSDSLSENGCKISSNSKEKEEISPSTIESSPSKTSADGAMNDTTALKQTAPNNSDCSNSNVTAESDKGAETKPLATESHDRPVKLRPQERKKIDFKDKLYLAPLTTVGNLPFRRICKVYGADITCGEMAMSTNLLQGHQSEWALLKRHASEDLFGVQVCGGYPDTMARCTQLLNDTIDVDFIDINVGCPIDMVFKKGEGSALMGRLNRFEQIVRNMTAISDIPVTVKMRTGIYENKQIAHTVIPRVKEWGVSLMTLHGRTREQRYTKMADWDYINTCSKLADPVPFFGNGDVLSFEDYNQHREQTGVSGIMVARGALIKPWLFTEIKEQRHWDISASERLDMLRSFTNYGLEHWGSDDQGVDTTRKFLLEWLSFLYRYIPVGVLDRVPQKINERPQPFFGRNDLETLMASGNSGDWVKISEMLLGPVKPGFTFLPKHKANAYK
ncbi:tRNA-dihydrouridine(47) synthase [NAD(P)(+)]-like [Lingula anatina]|uniref:tRNA-dihydrouridine(47) synthase [NAD(P)(+)] n=1 Tax=Lingula anatina TaxID=7574 RepID=A0A1S3I4L1_LINAN|nr:tRNA-dihydrouridine(47) synthase [NAD(P)(+)]-like [Lingula anatina]|eukprot:XP_013393205.1 tRNA-dihydrouridine(47) synthase [NAD(P)(+)]-like [Lingula anatina]